MQDFPTGRNTVPSVYVPMNSSSNLEGSKTELNSNFRINARRPNVAGTTLSCSQCMITTTEIALWLGCGVMCGWRPTRANLKRDLFRFLEPCALWRSCFASIIFYLISTVLKGAWGTGYSTFMGTFKNFDLYFVEEKLKLVLPGGMLRFPKYISPVYLPAML